MRSLSIAFLLCTSTCIQAEDAWLDETSFNLIEAAASQGEPHLQVLMGFLYELGYGVPQNTDEAIAWYCRAAQNGNDLALRRLGILTFCGDGVPKNEEMGMLLILLGAHDDLLPNLTTEEEANINELRQLWRNIQTQNRKQERMTRNCSRFKKQHHRSERIPIMLTTEWEPQDANNRIYGPGTGDWNVGILASDYEKMEKNLRDLANQINDASTWADEKKAQDLREQIERMQKESEQCKCDAYKAVFVAVGAAVGMAGSVLHLPIAVPFAAFEAVEKFKEAAREYVKGVDIEKEAQRLLDIERSLEHVKSFGARE
ncbi:MAG: hypothetical protein RLZZ453_786 [Chlamydiota bacterium]|jgi:hypothetical protein